MDFDTKIRFLAKQIVWIIIFVLIGPLCMWGIYTGVQYKNDPCVINGSSFGIALDWWLIFISSFDILFAIIVLILLCCQAKSRIRRAFIWPMHLINIIWMFLGIGLVIESDLRCQHNTLWVACLVNIILTATTATILFSVWILNTIGFCHKIGRLISLEETPYSYHFENQNPNL